MSDGDEERGEDNFGSDFMVGPNPRAHLPAPPARLPSFGVHLSLRGPPPSASPVSVFAPGGEAGTATLPVSSSSRFQALHGGLASWLRTHGRQLRLWSEEYMLNTTH